MRTRMRTLLARIERAEQAVKARSRCSPDCICFLENEQPEFRWRAEAEIAADVPCPLHVRFRIVVKRELYRALRFTSPTSSKGGLIIRRSIKKRCAPVSIWLCGRPEWIRKEELVRTRSLETSRRTRHHCSGSKLSGKSQQE